MSIFNTRQIKGVNLIEKITNILNMTKGIKQVEKPSRDKFRNEDADIDPNKQLSQNQLKFVESVSDDMTEEEIQDLKQKIIEDPSVIDSYQSRNLLKDVSSGQLKSKSEFAVDINFPARGFRAIKSKHS